jgi:hypothetical protein
MGKGKREEELLFSAAHQVDPAPPPKKIGQSLYIGPLQLLKPVVGCTRDLLQFTVAGETGLRSLASAPGGGTCGIPRAPSRKTGESEGSRWNAPVLAFATTPTRPSKVSAFLSRLATHHPDQSPTGAPLPIPRLAIASVQIPSVQNATYA